MGPNGAGLYLFTCLLGVPKDKRSNARIWGIPLIRDPTWEGTPGP